MTLNILAGNWLGEYGQYAMMKGVTYPLFCALCAVSRIPYTILTAVLNAAAALVLVKAVRPVIKWNCLNYILYVFLLYSPITFYDHIAQRLYRNVLTGPLVVFIFAGMFGIYFNICGKNRRRVWGYSVLTGICLFFFWNLREDCVWILPFLAVASVLAFVFALKHREKTGKCKALLKRAVVIVLPFLLLSVGNLTICGINYSHYGVFALNDRTHAAFSDVVGLFIKIDYDDTDPDLDENMCFMSEEKFEYIIDHSESLSEYKDIFLSAYESWASGNSKGKYVYGDHIQWCFRNGLEQAGLYTDGAALQDYLGSVRDELEDQIETGVLSEKSGIFLSSSTRMIQPGEIPYFIKRSITYTANRILSNDELYAQTVYSTGTDGQIREWEYVVNSFILYPADEGGAYARFSDRIVTIENHIISVFRFLSLPLKVIAFLSLGVLSVLQLPNIKWKNRLLFHRWIVLCAVWLSAWLFIFMFTIFSCWHNLNIPHYSSGAYMLVAIFEVLSVYFGVETGVTCLAGMRGGNHKGEGKCER
ncbi:MAG: hypothetical protein LUE19_02835 [Clostridiales bacterium]|nr:hypothetical protein [Clostridiales bacterium]